MSKFINLAFFSPTTGTSEQSHTDGWPDGSLATWDGTIQGHYQRVCMISFEQHISLVKVQDTQQQMKETNFYYSKCSYTHFFIRDVMAPFFKF